MSSVQARELDYIELGTCRTHKTDGSATCETVSEPNPNLGALQARRVNVTSDYIQLRYRAKRN